MTKQPASRRDFLKGLGLVTGAIAASTLPVNASGILGESSNNSSSPAGGFPTLDWSPMIIRVSDTEYRATYRYVGISKGQFIRSANPAYLGTYSSHAEASDALAVEHGKILAKISKD